MFKEKKEIKEKMESLWALAAKYDRGQTIPYVKIRSIIGEESDWLLEKLKRKLEREREIVSRRIAGSGVYLLTHAETAIEMPERRQRRSRKQMRLTRRQLKTVNVEQITQHERLRMVANDTFAKEVGKLISQSLNRMKKGIVATETNPQRKVG